MKVDKEALLKNRFWIGLGVFVPLWVIIFLVALFSSGDAKVKAEAEVKKTETKVKGISDIKNDRFTSLLEKKKADLQKQKDKVWKEAWKGQSNLMFWPRPEVRPEFWDHLANEGK